MPWTHPEFGWIEFRPDRIRMPDESTRTGDAVTDEALAEAGYVPAQWPEYRTDPVPFDEHGNPRY